VAHLARLTHTISYRIILHYIHVDGTTPSCIIKSLKKGPAYQYGNRVTRAHLITSFKLLCDPYFLHSTAYMHLHLHFPYPINSELTLVTRKPHRAPMSATTHMYLLQFIDLLIYSCVNPAGINRVEATQRVVLVYYCVPSCAVAFSIILHNLIPFKSIILIIISKPILNTVALSINTKQFSLFS
jgi:hypothetical protein